MHFYKKYGRKIVAKYRRRDKGKTLKSEEKVEPTFEEFVRYLVDTDLSLYADDHWIPYYLFCTPCLVDYDFIIHFETLDQDVSQLLQFLSNKMNEEASGGVLGGPEWKHKTSGGRSVELLHSYYRQLNKSTVEKLFQKYRLDFELFGYGDASDFIAIARDDWNTISNEEMHVRMLNLKNKQSVILGIFWKNKLL